METDITRAQAASEAYDRAYEQGARDALLAGYALVYDGESEYKLWPKDGRIVTMRVGEGE